MGCPKCHSNNKMATWSWSRSETETIGHGESAMDYKRFISRSTGFKCLDCGYKFLKYTTMKPTLAQELLDVSGCQNNDGQV